MKRNAFLTLLLALLFVFTLALGACGGGASESTSESASGSVSESTSESESESTSETETPTYYTVRFLDETGAELTSLSVKAGEVPSYTYEKSDTAEWDYTVRGWATSQSGEALSSLPAVTADATYYAVVTSEKQTYTVTLNTQGGTALPPLTVEYGGTVSELSKPEKENFRFVGWTVDGEELTLPFTVTGNVTFVAVYNEELPVLAYLKKLLGNYEVSPMAYLPESMLPSAAHSVKSGYALDLSSPVSLSTLPTGGFGEQWMMILSNLSQSQVFFNVMNAVESVTSTSVSAFQNYLDDNPSDTARHTFKAGTYDVTIDFDGEILSYVLSFDANVPVIGNVTAQIALAMDTETEEKTVRVQLGDANAMRYTVTEDGYEFAIRYLGVRRAYFSIEQQDDGTLEGHIYEHLTAADKVTLTSAADFYVDDDYVTAIGNKADGLLGFKGYVCEVYDRDSGKLLGYEVRETLSKLTFNTYWFDFANLPGFSSLKYVPANGEEKAYFLVNGSTKKWEPMNVGGISLKTASRRFDIELRNRYFTVWDEAKESWEIVCVEFPMFFVQEENFDTVVKDVKNQNGVQMSVGVSNADLDRISEDYDTLVDVFIANKELVTSDVILAFIGDKVVFD